ncbi:oxidoreductase [Alteromonas stellipolaris]|uniref:flavin reductase family protein n=1 Tax=Alteromonas stellipolaris TaxID=233316 RepID=UPI0007700E11|nr:iron-sulfur cluster-binding domain-containing protein [Alteromonas stellipolaris]AMJ95068.1 oxidoreductase [Alteromonas stellipolaris]
MQQFKPAWRDGYYRAQVEAVRNLKSDMVEVILTPEKAWPSHIAGQHIALTIEVNGRLTTRVFTVACGASFHRETKNIRLITKVNNKGAITPILSSVTPSTWVNISVPKGSFTLPNTDKPVLMVAGGSGITPFIAMLEDAIENKLIHRAPIHLLYFAKPNEHVLQSELLALQKRTNNFTFAFLTRQKDGDVEAHLSHFADAHWLVCGPNTIYEQVQRVAKLVEAPLDSEHFAALPTVNIGSLSEKETFSLVHNGQHLAVNNQKSLLWQLQEAKQPVTYGCGMGICHQCQCVKKRGVVRDTRTGELSDSAEQLIQLCVSQAVTDLEIQL